MKNNFLRWTSSDNVRAQIQKEEIDRIIKEHLKKKEQKKSPPIQHIAMLHKPKKDMEENKRKTTVFSIRKTRSKQLSRCPEKSEENLSYSVNLDQQINYFSIKKRYEKVIDSSFDHQLVNQLKVEMMTPCYSSRQNKTSNFFQKVFTKQNKIKQYFEGLRKERKTRMIVSEDLHFR